MKKVEIKNKLINHIMKNGEKKTSEKILLKSFKKLQKDCLKETKEVVKSALIFTTPIFKLHKIKNKKLKKKKRKTKEIPSFITTSQSRISLAIKLILKSLRKKSQNFYSEFQKELLLSSQKKGATVEIKNDLQKQVLLNKRYFNFYRW